MRKKVHLNYLRPGDPAPLLLGGAQDRQLLDSLWRIGVLDKRFVVCGTGAGLYSLDELRERFGEYVNVGQAVDSVLYTLPSILKRAGDDPNRVLSLGESQLGRGISDEISDLESRVEDVVEVWNHIHTLAMEIQSRRVRDTGVIHPLNAPVYPNAIVDRLVQARFGVDEGRELTIFTPWGPRYKIGRGDIREDDPEIATITELSEFFPLLSRSGFNVRWIVMPADVYGTEVNGLANADVVVDEYFRSLERALRESITGVTIDVRPWSELRETYSDQYKLLSEYLAETLPLALRVPLGNPGTPYSGGMWPEGDPSPLAIQANRPISKNEASFLYTGNLRKRYAECLNRAQAAKEHDPSRPDPEKSALAYLTQRWVEARLVETEFPGVIKLSAAHGVQNDVLDGHLPRFYPILHTAPWFEGPVVTNRKELGTEGRSNPRVLTGDYHDR